MGFTFKGGKGSSDIDYCLVGMDWMEVFETMEVAVEDFSDHLPVEMKCSFRQSFVDCIMNKAVRCQSKGFQEPWFDTECLQLRNCKFAWLKLWRNSGDNGMLQEYKRCSVQYKTLCDEKKVNYATKNVEELCGASNSSELWKAAHKIRGNPGSAVGISCDVYQPYVKKLLNPDIEPLSYSCAFPNISIEQLDRPITLSDVKKP